MKATGIVYRVDDLGRVVIPKEIRRTMAIKEGDALEIYTTNDGVFFRKYEQPAETKATIAQKWLEDNAFLMRTMSAKFSIENKTTICEIISNNRRSTGRATAMEKDTFIPAIGMVIAYCRAAGRAVPRKLLED